jgi:hypothetical protein
MARWAQFEAAAPALAAVAGRLWSGIVALHGGGSPSDDAQVFTIAYLATIHRDGAPRIHPFCPILAGGSLFAAIPRASPKGWDLRRDPRCTIHALPGPDDLELCIRAIAIEVTASEVVTMVGDVVARSGVGGMIETVCHDPLFEFDVQQVDVARWLDVGQPGTRAERQQWRDAGQG